MEDARANLEPPASPAAGRAAWAAVLAGLPALLVSAAATAWCWHAAGPGLGLYLGAVLLATIYTPSLVLAGTSPRDRAAAACGAVLGAACVLAASTGAADVTAGECFRCCLVLAAYVFALSGIAIVWESIQFPPSVAAALTTILAMAWVGWPVWLSPWMTQHLADRLTPVNPALAVNAVVRHLGSWDHAPVAYRALTVLDQDVPYHLPRSIFPAVLLHLLLGAPGLALIAFGPYRKRLPPS